MLYLVLGCGPDSMGPAIAARLLRETDSVVFIADQNPEYELATANKLKTCPTGHRSALVLANVRGDGLDVVKRKDDLPIFFRNKDIVISALPAHLNPIAIEAILKTNESRLPPHRLGKTHYCDLGGVLGITKKIIFGDMARRAESYGISLVPDCGLEPGLGNIMAISLLENFDLSQPLESLIIYVGGLPEKFYKKLFNLKGLEEIYYNWPFVLSRGKPRTIMPRSHYETIPTSDFDLFFGEKERSVKFEAAVTGGLGALPYYLKNHVLKLQEKTLRWPGHYDIIKKIKRENFIEEFEKLLNTYPHKQKDFSILRVVAIGKAKTTGKRTKIECFMYVESDNTWNSMQKSTGFTTAVLAKLIAEGKATVGAYPPEITMNPKLVLDFRKFLSAHIV
ncbi:MAG: hypothetical protein UW49_C0008G0002 [Candidatus Giovannonibacteria bacterium GW2011_GWB1_44_23]|uniref:Saccharopine dehydrogenase-like C-terminal domain-containing protein n=1 Tax=Candidatus Giovannonibacteria bacterium GW2011_GWB1_44_23 TaxID=1618652 RepID=A0A0G1ICS8_9BACT|nr:MAG: hypothetical protein UW49_C0008G0002 [Candidatus Giovannonibacteria bacterium GW2011_GWB1_44_23]